MDPKKNAKKIGKRLKELRGERSQEEVATAIGISVSAVTMYENGERVPRDDVKVKLAIFFNTTVQALFFDL